MPHGTRPLANRNLRGIEARRDVSGAGTIAESGCRTKEAHDARYVRAHLRHVSYERAQRTRCHPRSIRAIVLLSGKCGYREAPKLCLESSQDETNLRAVPYPTRN